MFRAESTGETSGPHPRPDLAVKYAQVVAQEQKAYTRETCLS